MNKKAINIICSIGDMALTRRAIKSLEIERNFSDVSNKFSMVIIDTPQTGLTDLELYMCAGNRSISISYNDNPDSSGFVAFKGQIWDYTSSFVGNIKQLTISGYISKTVTYDTSGTAFYNIDWNNYFCLRANTLGFWNVYYMHTKDVDRHSTWLERNKESYQDDKSQYISQNQNVVEYKDFSALYTQNAITLKVKGPGGEIDLPIPDSFAPMVFASEEEDGYAGDNVDPKNYLWGELGAVYVDPRTAKPYVDPDDKPIEPPDPENYDIFWVQQNDRYSDGSYIGGAGSYRAFKLVNDSQAYIQLNPAKPYFGSGTFINSSLGVDPSYIVKQLCTLEGWDFDDSTIVQTSMVPNSDAFKMSNQTALAYIMEVLAPISITPTGIYTTKDGKEVYVKEGQAGFTCWFDSNNKFHYEPISNLYRQDKRNILLGYNIPNSPVISFQVDTKGTCFYTTNAQKINSIYITTGKEVESIDITSSDLIDEYNKVSGHNEKLDEFFGFTYDQINALYKNNYTNDLYLGFGDKATIDTKIDKSKYNSNLATVTPDEGLPIKIESEDVNNKLVTSIPSSGAESGLSLATQLKDATSKIEMFMITATLNMWGNTEISPSTLINITNMVKSTDSDYTSKHPTSGDYLVLKQVDRISTDSFTQTLSLIRANTTLYSNINPQNIDYSKGVKKDETKTSSEKREEAYQELEDKLNTNNPSVYVNTILSLWDEYLSAIARKHPSWIWWGNRPAIYEDILIIDLNNYGDKSTSWYRYGKKSNGLPSLDMEDFWIDPMIESWLTKAKEAKQKGTLGDKILHDPVTMPDTMDRSKMEFDLTYKGPTLTTEPTKPTYKNPNTPELPNYSGGYLDQRKHLLMDRYNKFNK